MDNKQLEIYRIFLDQSENIYQLMLNYGLSKETSEFYQNWEPIELGSMDGSIYEGSKSYKKYVYVHKEKTILLYKSHIRNNKRFYGEDEKEEIVEKEINIKFLIKPNFLQKLLKMNAKEKVERKYGSNLFYFKPALRIFYNVGTFDDLYTIFNTRSYLIVHAHKFYLDFIMQRIEQNNLFSIEELNKIIVLLNKNFHALMDKRLNNNGKEENIYYTSTYVTYCGFYTDWLSRIINDR